ncbi:tRNA (N(6)-L-threonylcarbamoyladenosine(37)-C(2))-methylthiotransferase MtaB [Aliidongia dinghuensis]|nr:tRNA (N(6)-L-threonylcarbamoyladenosine(37)-C(2))-methylthiotransferase MtaB [Aliidongia dinghuensis]
MSGLPGAGLELLTFGCRLNIYESEVMRRLAGEAGLADAVIVNTCAVTAEAERQSRQAIRRAHRRRPEAPIIVTGCAAQLHPDRFAAMPEVARVLGNGEKLTAAAWDPGAAPLMVGDAQALSETASHLLDGFDGHARAFLQVQQGCDHRCTFCIIPLARGPNRSVPVGQIVAQAQALVEAGYRELVLTGVDLTAYGADLPGCPTLGQMVRRLLALVPALPRLRLSSLDPVEIDEDLWRLVAEEPRLMPHLHLSVQAGDDLVLKRMKRRHGRADVLKVADRARASRPGVALGADLIAGFPTESEAAFQRTLDLVDEAGLTHLHVFPFSARAETPAARMPPVPGDQVRERAARLRAKGAEVQAGFLARAVGTVAEVLMERGGIGHTAHYAPLRPDRPVAVGHLFRARVTAVDGDQLVGEVE